METIKEYATRKGVTAQSVYKRINSKKLKDRLKGHVVEEYGVKCLDDIAVAILDETKSLSHNTLSIVKNNESLEELNKLKDENARLKDELIAKQNKYENVLEQLLMAQNQIAEKEKQLLEYKNKESKAPEKEELQENKEIVPEPTRENWFKRLFKKKWNEVGEIKPYFFISGEHTNNTQTTSKQQTNNKPTFKPLTTYGYKGL